MTVIPPKVYIIAEAGVNHNGSVEMARELVREAARSGADAVKFQTFRAENLVTEDAVKAEYQVRTSGAEESQFDMLKRLELDTGAHKILAAECGACGVDFLSSAFDLLSIDQLAGIGMKKWKIPSGEITNLPYLRKIAGLRQEVILSTGMANLEEIRAALDVFTAAGVKRGQITILHCNTAYPTPMEDVNLKAMLTIGNEFPGVSIGYSDHTEGIEIPVAAVALGARIIEKHFTLDRALPGPDHSASITPDQLEAMVKAIRNVEIALGTGVKVSSFSEKKNISIARKSIVAACGIKAGDLFSPDNLTVKRPGDGLTPMKWDEIIGRKANKNYSKDEKIDSILYD